MPGVSYNPVASDPEGNIRLPNQVPPSIRSTISDEEIKKGKKGQKNIFCIRACAGTDHERVLHLRSQSTSNMVEWVNNINAVVRLLHHKKASMDTNRMHQRVSVMFDVLMHQEDEESLSKHKIPLMMFLCPQLQINPVHRLHHLEATEIVKEVALETERKE